jgi:hypothetical protein
MSEEIKALTEAIQLEKENLLNLILERLGYAEVDEDLFQDLLKLIDAVDAKRFKYSKALEGQQVVDKVLKDRLV